MVFDFEGIGWWLNYCPPKCKLAPENQWLEEEIFFEEGLFSAAMFVVGRGRIILATVTFRKKTRVKSCNFTALDIPNTSWEGVSGIFGGESKYILNRCLDVWGTYYLSYVSIAWADIMHQMLIWWRIPLETQWSWMCLGCCFFCCKKNIWIHLENMFYFPTTSVANSWVRLFMDKVLEKDFTVHVG